MPNALAFAGPTQNRLLHIMMRHRQPASIDFLAGKLGITKTAVRQHITNLERDGYIERQNLSGSEGKAAQRGRPQYAYALSERGGELFTRHYALFSERLIVQMKAALGDDEFTIQMRSLGENLASELAGKMPANADLPTQIKALSTLMHELGYDSEIDQNGDIIAHNCVYHDLANAHPQVCEVDLALMHKLAGVKPEHKACMVRGDSICRFSFKG
jgi:predicted ArsR family transcriptional regulator